MPEVVRRRHKRPRPQTSCRVCHQRKVRCNRELPCDQCIKHRCAQDCQFDGIPAKNGDPPSTPSWSSTGSVGRGSEDGAFPLDQTTGVGWPFESNAAFDNQSYGDEATSVKPYHGSRLPAHKWPNDSQTRGRTHYSWLLKEFNVLKGHVDRAASETGQDSSVSILVRRKQAILKFKHQELDQMPMVSNVYDELPPVAVCCDLIVRYFETFDSIYPIMDREEFNGMFNAMLTDPSSVSICFAIQVLLMQGLANATYPDEQAPIARATVLRWLDLAASTPGSAMEMDELDLEIVRLFALAILGRQVLKYNETRDYVMTCTCARAAMTLGLHRAAYDESTAACNRRSRHALWEMIQDLELQACLTAGMVPCTSPPRASQTLSSQDAPRSPRSSESEHDIVSGRGSGGIPSMLSASLPIRHKIVSALNSESDLHFEKVVQLSRELTRSLAPVSTLETLPESMRTFEYQYISFVYTRFLIALHRPFATLNDPAFYWSRTLCVRLAKQYVQELFANLRGQGRYDAFGTLLLGHGSLFRVEALNAIMILCYELFRFDDEGVSLESVTQPGTGRAAITAMLEQFVPFGQKMMQTYELEGRLFLLPFMVLAHLDGVRQFPLGSESYHHYLAQAAESAVGQCYSLWPQLDLHQAGFT